MHIQIIRGLPGAGKSTLAKSFDCMHLELDMFCLDSRRYLWTPQADRRARERLRDLVQYMMYAGNDIVVVGVFPDANGLLGTVVDLAATLGHKVFVKTLTERHPNVHCVRTKDLERFEREFVDDRQLQIDLMARAKGDRRKIAWLADNVIYGVMPEKSLVIQCPENAE